MSGEQESDDSTDFSRRTFMRASGAAAAAGVLGAGAAAAPDARMNVRREKSVLSSLSCSPLMMHVAYWTSIKGILTTSSKRQ